VEKRKILALPLLLLILLSKHNLVYKIKKVCAGNVARIEYSINELKNVSETLKGRNNLKDADLELWINLKWILKNENLWL
jgi:hypothetical protein